MRRGGRDKLKERVQNDPADHDPMTFHDIKFLMILIINYACGLLSSLFLFVARVKLSSRD